MGTEPEPPTDATLAALKRAGQEARRTAVATGTAVVVREGGRLVRIPAEQIQAELTRASIRP